MARCWNCEHLGGTYSGKPANEKLFERECEDCEESKHKIKYEEIAEIRRQTFHIAGTGTKLILISYQKCIEERCCFLCMHRIIGQNGIVGKITLLG